MANCENVLTKNLLRRKLAMPDEFGGFVLEYESGCLIGADGEINPAISVLSSLATGTYFWTNAMDVNARLAAGQAGRLVKTLSKNSVSSTNDVGIGNQNFVGMIDSKKTRGNTYSYHAFKTPTCTVTAEKKAANLQRHHI